MHRYRLLFVCHGNTCRSPMAEGVFRDLVEKAGRGREFAIASAGTHARQVGAPPDPRAVAAAREIGIDIAEQRCRQLQPADLAEHELLLALDQANLVRLRMLALPGRGAHCRPLMEFASGGGPIEVPDPWAGQQTHYAEALELIRRGCRGLLAALPP